MITCCEVAIVLAITNILSLAIFAGYTVHWKERTLKLEKKNGHEQHQIDEIKSRMERVETKLSKDPKNVPPKKWGDKN